MFKNIWRGFCSEGTITRNIPSVQTSDVCSKAPGGRMWGGGGEMSNLFLANPSRGWRGLSRENFPLNHCSSLRLPSLSQHSWWGGEGLVPVPSQLWQDSVWWWREHAQLSRLPYPHTAIPHTPSRGFWRGAGSSRHIGSDAGVTQRGPMTTSFLLQPSENPVHASEAEPSFLIGTGRAESRAGSFLLSHFWGWTFLKFICATSGVYTGSAAFPLLWHQTVKGRKLWDSFLTATEEL